MSPAKATACLLLSLCILLAGSVAGTSASAGRAEQPEGTASRTSVAVPSAVLSGESRATDISWVARIMIRTVGRNRPGFDMPSFTVIQPTSIWQRGPQHLLVLDRLRVDGSLWLRVRLATRPNDSNAWIPADRVRLIRNPWRVSIYLKNHRVTVFRAGRREISFRAVIGAPDTPTPKGLFAIYERVRQPDPSDFLGPFALHLTAHSNVLDNYGGGPGRVAIHGRAGASLVDPLGTSRSHGCVRIANGRVVWMAKNLPLGTPVRIR